MKTAEIHTPKGIMKVSFFEEDAPLTVENFVKLAEDGFTTVLHSTGLFPVSSSRRLPLFKGYE